MKKLDFEGLSTTDDEGFKIDLITKGDRKAIIYKLIGFCVLLVIIHMITIEFSFDEGVLYLYIPATIFYIALVSLTSNRKIIYTLQLIKTGCFRESGNQKLSKSLREEIAYDSTKKLFSTQ